MVHCSLARYGHPLYLSFLLYRTGLDNALRVFGLHKDVHMNMELSQGVLLAYVHTDWLVFFMASPPLALAV